MRVKLTIFTDGASRGNPGPASYGFFIQDENSQTLYEEGKYLGVNTNNFAEYSAVLNSLLYIKNSFKNISELNFFMDSKLVVEQLSGRFKIKNEKLKKLIAEIRALETGVKITYSHIPREKNKIADFLANKVLDSLN